MQTFKQFCESSWDKYVYHATYDKDVKFKAGHPTFVGSLHAAMARAYASKGKRSSKDLTIHAFKHEPTNKATKIKHPSMNRGESNPKRLQGQLKKGSSHLSYRNEVEDPGSESRIVFNPKELKHVKSFKAPKFADRKYKSKDYEPRPGGARMTMPYFFRTKGERKAKKL